MQKQENSSKALLKKCERISEKGKSGPNPTQLQSASKATEQFESTEGTTTQSQWKRDSIPKQASEATTTLKPTQTNGSVGSAPAQSNRRREAAG